MVRVINNNLWTPVPWGFGCGGHKCNGGGWMNNMLKYQFMFGMMNNISNMFRCYVTPPQQQGDFYPGLYLGGGGGAMPQNYEEYLQQQQDTQSLSELKSAYSEFNIRKIGDRYFAYLKSDKTQRVEADTVDELMDGLNAYVDENPDKFKTKPAKAETSRVDGEGNIERDDVADASEVDDGATVRNNDNNGNSPANNNRRRQQNGNEGTRHRGVQVPSDWHRRGINQTWYNTHFITPNREPTAANVIDVLLTTNNITCDNNTRNALVDELIEYNPSCYDKETGELIGNINNFKYNKLDIPPLTPGSTINLNN